MVSTAAIPQHNTHLQGWTPGDLGSAPIIQPIKNRERIERKARMAIKTIHNPPDRFDITA